MAEFKEQGNKFYAEGDYRKAVQSYTKAIKAEPTNHVYYRYVHASPPSWMGQLIVMKSTLVAIVQLLL